MMMEGAGFEVINLGINNPVEKYLEALEEHQPDILGMSALLTTTMPYMKVVIDTLQQKGLRDKYIVLVGGAPLNEEFAQGVGADAYCRDAAVAVETAKSLIAARRAATLPRPLTVRRRRRRARPDHRLRSARARDRRAQAAQRLVGHGRAVPAAGAAQPPGAHPGGRARSDRAGRERYAPHLRRLRRLRHRRPLDAVLERNGVDAPAGRALLRVLRGRGRVRRRCSEAEPGRST